MWLVAVAALVVVAAVIIWANVSGGESPSFLYLGGSERSRLSTDDSGRLTFPIVYEGSSFIRKHDLKGNTIWVKNLGKGTVLGIAVASSGDVYVVRRTVIFGSAPNVLEKYDGDGKLEWLVDLGIGSDVPAVAVVRDSAAQRDRILVGGTSSAKPNEVGFVRQYSAAGELIWSRDIGPGRVIDIEAGDDSSIYVAGRLESHGFLRKLGVDGSTMWSRDLQARYVGKIALAGSKKLYVGGSSWDDEQSFIYEYDNEGNLVLDFDLSERTEGLNGVKALVAGKEALFAVIMIDGRSVLRRYSPTAAIVWELDGPHFNSLAWDEATLFVGDWMSVVKLDGDGKELSTRELDPEGGNIRTILAR